MNHKTQTNNYTDFFYYTFRNILLVGIPFVIIFALVLSIPHSSATVSGASADSLTLSLPTSCTLSSVVNSAHNATLISGTYTSDIGKTTITTLCNDGNGYAIYANGLSNDTVGNNTLISSVSDNHDIETGIYEQGDTTSSWAMKLGNIESDTSPTPPIIEQTYDNTYGLVPSTWTKVAGRQSGTTDMITGSAFTTTYAVYTSPTQHAGTYTGQVAYALIHGSGDSPTPIYFMQDVANWKDSLQLEENVQAVDIRDSKTYWVTKLKDGNIWMTQNLDLCIGCSGTAALTSENTDLSTTASGSGIYDTAYGYSENNGVWTWTPASTAITSEENTGDSYTAPYSEELGDVYYYTSGSDTDDIKYISLSDCVNANHTEASCRHYHVGNRYNWTASIASNNSANISSNYANASNSICPKGWRLPIATNKDKTIFEFGDLLYTYYGITTSKFAAVSTTPVSYTINGFDKIRTSPLWFARYNGSTGAYHSSTVANNSSVYSLYFNKSGVYPFYSDAYSRRYTWSIRCLAR